MAGAVCSNCGKYYRWRARRGYRLSEFPSPCCKAPGLGMNKKLTAALVRDPAKGYYVPNIAALK